MGKDLAGSFESVSIKYEEASEVLGFDLAAVCFEGPESDLKQTRVTQPALYVHSLAVTDLIRERGIEPVAAAGHSLGEYSALAAAGVFSFADGLKLVKARAEAMQFAGTENPGTMAAVIGLDESGILKLCEAAADGETLVPANFNSPGQVVVSGSIEAIDRVVKIAREHGARLAKRLPVSGAFHSPLMEPAAEHLKIALDSVTFAAQSFPVISNVTARAHTDAESVRKLLADQLLSPVRWTESMHELNAIQPTNWFEVGSGNVLSGLVKRTLKDTIAIPVGTAADLQTIHPEEIEADG